MGAHSPPAALSGGPILLGAAAAILLAAALESLPDGFHELVAAPVGGIDLRWRYEEVRAWFAGEPVYGRYVSGYQPDGYLLLWLLVGWLPWGAVRWLAAALFLLAMAALARVLVRAAGARPGLEALTLALVVFAANATGVTLTTGQLVLFLLPPLILSLELLRRSPPTWRHDLSAAALFLLALVKSTLAAPFFWLILFVPGRLRPAALVVGGHALLNVLGSLPQPGAPWAVYLQGLRASVRETGKILGYGHVHVWLNLLGLGAWKLPVSLLLLGCLGFWVRRRRRGDLWALAGVTAIVARMWAYHRLYDDLVVLLALPPLWRAARSGPAARLAQLLSGALVFAFLLPTRLIGWPAPWPQLFTALHVVAWVGAGLFLARSARVSRRGEPVAAG